MAADSGANAAKFQHFQADTIVSDYGFKNLKINFLIKKIGKNQFMRLTKMQVLISSGLKN